MSAQSLRFLFASGLIVLAPALAADPAPKGKSPSFQVPYRLTDTKHVLVRVKINGKGPFNFILDTGAPALFVSTKLCRKLDVEADADGWGRFDHLEIEGGVVLRKVPGRVDDPHQIEGMNRLGLAGVPLHGVIGYNLLARYRLTFDFAKDKMTWTPLNFDPPLPKIGGQKSGVDALGGLAGIMATLLGKQLEREVRFRGLLGMELAEKDGKVFVQKVLAGSPADKAILRKGDELAAIDGRQIASIAEAERLLHKRVPGDKVGITIRRDGMEESRSVLMGRGF